MPNSKTFVEYALDLLEGVGPVEARRMFGGHGIYARGVMFGLLDDDELFLKTDAVSRPTFVAAGCRAWVYAGRNGEQETSYRRPPDDAHESPDAMLPWATLALEAALRLAAAKKPKRRKPAVKKAGARTPPVRKAATKPKTTSRAKRRGPAPA